MFNLSNDIERAVAKAILELILIVVRWKKVMEGPRGKQVRPLLHPDDVVQSRPSAKSVNRTPHRAH